MSQEFLAKLLTLENRVKSNPGQVCNVCLQECETISAETGIIECPIRLPCTHVIGSACIARWLHTNNTCPMCRREFFPAEPRASGSDSDDEDEDENEEEEEVGRITELCREFCRGLGFSPGVFYYVLPPMALNLYRSRWYGGHSPDCAVALTIYMISHIVSQVQSLDEISRVSQIPVPHILEAYRLIHPTRERLIPGSLPAILSKIGGNMDGFLRFLPAPTPEMGFIDDRREHDITEDVEMVDPKDDETDNGTQGESDVELEILCEDFCVELGYGENAVAICQSMARKIHGEYLQDSRPYPRRTAAVSIYMASHLIGKPNSVERISNVVGVSEATLREDYAIVWDWRSDVIDAKMLENVGNIDIRRALRAVPPLVWPALLP